MAVAVKNKSEMKTSPQLARLPIVIVLGVLYVLGTVGIVFPLLDAVWWTWLGFERLNPWAWVGRIGVGFAVGIALVALGLKMLGPEPPRGLRGGITVGVTGVFVVLLLALSIGTAIEGWVYSWAALGASSWLVGIFLTAAIGIALLVGLFWLLFNRSVDRALGTLEDQGWFEKKGYKSNQGQKVRRGTILGILIIFGTGILGLGSTLDAAGDWTVNVPFTGKVLLTSKNVGENPEKLGEVKAREAEIAAWETKRTQALADVETVLTVPAAKKALEPQLNELSALPNPAGQEVRQLIADALSKPPTEKDPETVVNAFKEKFAEVKAALTAPEPQVLTLDRFKVRDLNQAFKSASVRIVDPGSDVAETIEVIKPDGDKEVLSPTEDLQAGQTLSQVDFDRIKSQREKRLEARPNLLIKPPTADAEVAPIREQVTSGLAPVNYVSYYNLTVLPSLKYTAPFLLALLGLWFAWRIVNMPAFADFLIATEAELNKVSWTTQKRLIQDTVVVLVTVIMLTFFLFFADIGWSTLLKFIGVLQTTTSTAKQEKQPW